MPIRAKGSIVASGRSAVNNSNNFMNNRVFNNRLKKKYSILGFIAGVASSVISSYIYDYITK
ncbi:MAG: hypothetical protein Tsb002_06570 [Wenzhouxiangellaceae bacterium]